MKALMLGWDPSAAMDAGYIGDLPQRLQEYGKQVEKLFLVTYAPKKMSLSEKKVAENVTVIPTSSSILTFPFVCYRIASKIIREEKIDVVDTQDPYFTGIVGYALKLRYGIPLIVEMHGEDLDNRFWLRERWFNRVLNMIGKTLVRKADAVRVDSVRIREYMTKIGVPPEKIFELPVYSNCEKFMEPNPKAAEIRKKYSGYDNIVLSVGRLSWEKNHANLISAAPKVLEKFPKTLFLIVGRGKEESALRKLAADLGVEKNVTLEGYVEDVAAYYQAADVFALPSSYEGRAIVLVEALASGLPVVSTDVSGARDVVKEGESGYVVPVGDPAALAEKVIILLGDPKKRKSMADAGRRLAAETQDIRKNAHKLREMYDSVVARHEAKK